MKKIIKNGLVAMLILASGSNLNATSLLLKKDVERGMIYIQDSSKIIIKDAKNNIIYTINSTETIVNNVVNYLPNLESGDYTLEMESEFAIQIHPFSVNHLDVTFKSDLNYTIFKPVIITEGKKVNLSRFSPNMEMIKVRIFDYYGHLLHEESIENQTRMNRTYDFSQIKESKISIVLESNTRTFTENITF